MHICVPWPSWWSFAAAGERCFCPPWDCRTSSSILRPERFWPPSMHIWLRRSLRPSRSWSRRRRQRWWKDENKTEDEKDIADSHRRDHSLRIYQGRADAPDWGRGSAALCGGIQRFLCRGCAAGLQSGQHESLWKALAGAGGPCGEIFFGLWRICHLPWHRYHGFHGGRTVLSGAKQSQAHCGHRSSEAHRPAGDGRQNQSAGQPAICLWGQGPWSQHRVRGQCDSGHQSKEGAFQEL